MTTFGTDKLVKYLTGVTYPCVLQAMGENGPWTGDLVVATAVEGSGKGAKFMARQINESYPVKGLDLDLFDAPVEGEDGELTLPGREGKGQMSYRLVQVSNTKEMLAAAPNVYWGQGQLTLEAVREWMTAHGFEVAE